MAVYLSWFCCGILIGIVFSVIILRRVKYDGILRIDSTDPVKDKYSLELTTSLEELPEKRAVVLRIVSATL